MESPHRVRETLRHAGTSRLARASRSRYQTGGGRRPPWAARTFTNVDDDVRESMRLIRDCPYLLSHEVRGTVYDVETGHLREIV